MIGVPAASPLRTVTLEPSRFLKVFKRSDRRARGVSRLGRLRPVQPIGPRTLRALERWARKKALSLRGEGEGLAYSEVVMEVERDPTSSSWFIAVSFYWVSDERLGEGRVLQLPYGKRTIEVPLIEPLTTKDIKQEKRLP